MCRKLLDLPTTVRVPHTAQGMKSPFEVYNCRQPNIVRKRLLLGERKALEDSEEGENEFQIRSPRKNVGETVLFRFAKITEKRATQF